MTLSPEAGTWGPAPKAGALETACVKQIDEFAAAVRSERTPVFRCAVGERQHRAQSAIHMNRFRNKHRPAVPEPHVDKRKTELLHKHLRRMIRRIIPAPDEKKDDDDECVGYSWLNTACFTAQFDFTKENGECSSWFANSLRLSELRLRRDSADIGGMF